MPSLLDILKLPAECLIEQKIPKKSLSQNVQQSSVTANQLTALESISLKAHITPHNTNIPAYVDEVHEYLELFHIRVVFKEGEVSDGQSKFIHRLIHQSIAYPVLLELCREDERQWSVADKSINQANPQHEQLVLKEILMTDWLPPIADELQNVFYQRLAFANQDQSNLMQLYTGWISTFVSYLTADSLGRKTFNEVPVNNAIDLISQRAQLQQIQELQMQIKALQLKRNAAVQFNEKVAINVELQKLQLALKNLST
ncbi:DUF4391 domain-containing protein [Oligella sp. HMSC09E12]|uniref:DUF4391 domain-containing protein n=1 Tax=Oligella sp. HMSC09E12 TaxID=1581147 RepID=UPI0008A36A10|nr:DUF4391 domain-containing protein [Oligella sp. HMSC09E12]OFV47869.1 hypothetical protein HMPREF3179_07395 [Oligella sp. HMSC09E12]